MDQIHMDLPQTNRLYHCLVYDLMHLLFQIHNLQLLIFDMDGLEFLVILD